MTDTLGRDLSQVLADAMEEASTLRANGHAVQAGSIERVCAAVRESSALWLEWRSERESILQSGRRVDYFRSRFDAWQRDRMAEMRGRNRYYRACVVPRQELLSIVREQARRGA